MQRSLLPQARPQVDGFEFFDFCQYAGVLGGDYYDYLTRPSGRLALIVADCAGMIPSKAVMMTVVAGEAKSCFASESSPAAAMRTLNERLVSRQPDSFTTMLLVVLDPESHEATIVNAGHTSPIWRHADGTVEDVETTGLPLGIVEGFPYEEKVVRLSLGDMLLLCTEGLYNGTDPEGHVFTIDRLRSHLSRCDRDATTAGSAIVWEALKHIGPAPPTDDITLVCVRRVPVGTSAS